MMRTQYITDDRGNKIAVIMSIGLYEKMMDDLDELECIRAYDRVKNSKQVFIPAKKVFKAVDQKRNKG